MGPKKKDEQMVPLRGMYGPLDAEFEVRRTIKWTELTAFPCRITRIVGATTAHVETKGIIDGLWRGQMARKGRTPICAC